MPLFPSWLNSIVYAALVVMIGGAVVTLVVAFIYVRSPFNTDEREPREQPVQFDHRHHVGDDGIDCRFCHYSVEVSKYAGVPPVALCMNCHNQLWSDAAILEPVRSAYFNDTTLTWKRLNSMPDYVYFNHAVHVNRGVGCKSCHGDLLTMPAVYKAAPMTMGWCLDCHRDPAPHLRPAERITDMVWEPHDNNVGASVQAKLGIKPPVNCSGCHR